MIGRRLCHYRTEERLGAGGMGEVYRARDEKLGRDVALKVLPSGALADDEARRRFRREAEALSRLSHPHIATLFDFDSADGVDFLVMELVLGPTLEHELRKGPLPEKDVVRLGSQLARGLQAAHEQGVIHRDLKPSNLQLTADGLLKILDFGVAHLERGGTPTGGEATATETAAGEVLGSPPYMAPEQLLGKPIDARTDLYAAGACLYELATGKRPHGDRRGAQLTEAILHEAPIAPRSLNGGMSSGLEAVILKALDKDPRLRYQTAKDLLVDLERLQAVATSGSASEALAVARPRRRHWPWLVAAAALLALGTAWLLWPPAAPRIVNARALTAGLEVDIPDDAGAPGWTTDGTRLYYLGMSGTQAALFQLPATGGEAVEIPLPFALRRQIHGYLPEESALLMTGSDLVYESQSAKGRPLWIVPVPAGAPSRLGRLEALSAAATSDGRQLALVQPERIVLARRDGSTIRELGSLPSPPLWIQWAPDGQRLRFTAVNPDGRERWIWEVLAAGGRPRPLWPGERGRWTRDGRYYVFGRRSESDSRSDIYAVREPRFPWSSPSTPARLTSGPLSFDDPGPSPDGKRLFAWGRIDRGELLRYDARTGRFHKHLGGASVYYVDASADGRWLTWVSYPEGALWKSREDGTQRLRLTPLGWRVYVPRWSPDGTSIAFAGASPAERLLQIFHIPADGGEPQLLVRHDGQGSLWDACWLPDGRAIVYSYQSRHGIYRVDLRTREVSMLPGTERMLYPKCSARGDILAMEHPAEGGPRSPYWARFVDRDTWECLGDLDLAHPDWARDAQTLIGLNVRERRIERWSRKTRRLETVAEVGDIPLVSWVHVPWMGLAPDGAPLVVRDRSTRDLYALEWEAP